MYIHLLEDDRLCFTESSLPRCIVGKRSEPVKDSRLRRTVASALSEKRPTISSFDSPKESIRAKESNKIKLADFRKPTSSTSTGSNGDSSPIFEKNKLPISAYNDLLNFKLELAWKPFDDAIKSLNSLDALELSRPALTLPDGRQEFQYKDGSLVAHTSIHLYIRYVSCIGHREILFSNGMRKVVVRNVVILSVYCM